MTGPEQAPSELMASIYEAAAEPDRWPEVLHAASTWIGGIAGSLQARRFGPIPSAMMVSSGIGDEHHQSYLAHHAKHDPHLKHLASLTVGRGLLSCEVVPDEDLVRTEFYNDFWLPQGLRDLQGVVLVRNDDWAVTLATFGHANRCFDEASKTRLLTIATHFKRALDLSFHFDARSSPDRLLDVSLRVGGAHRVHVDRDCRVVDFVAGPGIDALRGGELALSIEQGVVHAREPLDQERLQAAVHAALRGESSCHGFATEHSVLIAALAPGPRISPLVRERCATLVFRWTAQQDARTTGLAVELLPPSLRDVGRCLVDGLSDKEIAARLQMPLATARTYVHRVLKRLGATNRRELMRR